MAWVDSNPTASLEQFKETKKNLEKIAMPLMGKIYT